MAARPPKTWIVKVEMRDPAHIKAVPASGPPTFTDEDAAVLRQRLAPLPLDAPRSLINCTVDDGGTLIAFFETTTQPSKAECVELYRLTAAALGVFRRPSNFNCVKTYEGPKTEINYLP
jgi:hypothetical protein